MIKSTFLITSLLLFTCCFSAKEVIEPATYEDLWVKEKFLNHLSVDAVGNVYAVKNNRSLIKYKSDGKIEQTYDEQSGGFISTIDVNNPLYILIFYRDSRRIDLLDRNLALLQQLDIDDWTTDDITTCRLANDNTIWLYNNTARQLQKYNIEGKLILSSFDLYGMTTMETDVNHLLEVENKVFLQNEEGSLIVLNNLGQFIKDIPSGFIQPIFSNSGVILGVDPPKIERISLRPETNSSMQIPSNFQKVEKIIIHQTTWYGLHTQGILKMELP